MTRYPIGTRLTRASRSKPVKATYNFDVLFPDESEGVGVTFVGTLLYDTDCTSPGSYEGILATDMTGEHQTVLISIISAFLTLLPPKPLESRLNQIVGFFSETYFSWIGCFSPADAFYYRIQSPVALFEFDHHSGVFLTNDEPAKYHIHTIQRLPNGNDYGRELRKLALARETN